MFLLCIVKLPSQKDALFSTFTNGLWTCLKFHPLIPYHLFLPISLSTSLPNPRPSLEGGRPSTEGIFSSKYVEHKSWAHSWKPQTCPLFEHCRQFLLGRGMPSCCMLASLLHVDCWLSCIWVNPLPHSFLLFIPWEAFKSWCLSVALEKLKSFHSSWVLAST